MKWRELQSNLTHSRTKISKNLLNAYVQMTVLGLFKISYWTNGSHVTGEWREVRLGRFMEGNKHL